MKRILSACLEQTLHFRLKDAMPHDAAVRMVREEYTRYREQLDRNRTQYRILSEHEQADGSLIVWLKKQYNNHDCGDYLD